MHQQLNSIDLHRNIRSYTSATFVFNCVFFLFICLILSILILALIPLYLPFHNFIPANLDNNNIIPNKSNTSTVFIDDKNWPIIEQTIENLLNLKVNNIQFTNTSDVRIVDSISETMSKIFSFQSKHISTTWCNINGCLRILGKIMFSINCPLACQLHQMNKIEILNLIEPSIKMNLNSTLNISYTIELDAFTIIVSEDQENGDQVKTFLLYNLIENHSRALSSLSVSVDNSSLVNITHLISNSIIQSHMNIYKFTVIQAEVIIGSSILNVTVLFIFNMKCINDCQQIQINKLKNTISIILDPIVIIYDRKVYFYNISLIDVFVVTSTIILTTENTIILNNITTTEITSISILNTTELIFEVNFKLEPFDLILDGDLEVGPITDNSTLNDLTTMMQTTVSNDSNITVIVFNATIKIDDEISTTRTLSSDSFTYILHLIVYYIYAIPCDECVAIINDAVYNEPQLHKLIQIRNASVIDVSRPIIVINITSNPITTILSSTHTVSMSTIPFSTTGLDDSDTLEAMSLRLIHTITHSTTSQHQITEHTTSQPHVNK